MPLTHKYPWWHKTLISLLVALAVVNGYRSAVFYRLQQTPMAEINVAVYKYLFPVLVLMGIVFVCGFPLLWRNREKHGRIDPEKVHAIMVAIVRYWLALEISQYGVSKLLHLQFGESFVRNDSVAGNMSGFSLTWLYFSHSYAFNCIIGAIQVGGAIMLLFRPTVLPAVLILLPVMVNIVLIDLFYGIPLTATLNAIYFTSGLLYLFFLHWEIIKPVFTKTLLRPVVAFWPLKYGVRVLVIGAAVAYSVYVSSFLRAPVPMAGKWKVTKTLRNNVEVSGTSWISDASAWQHIYIEHYKTVTCSPNPYIAEAGRAESGSYELNEAKDTMTLRMHRQDKTYKIRIHHINPDVMTWEFRNGIEAVRLNLERVANR